MLSTKTRSLYFSKVKTLVKILVSSESPLNRELNTFLCQPLQMQWRKMLKPLIFINLMPMLIMLALKKILKNILEYQYIILCLIWYTKLLFNTNVMQLKNSLKLRPTGKNIFYGIPFPVYRHYFRRSFKWKTSKKILSSTNYSLIKHEKLYFRFQV